MADFLNDFIDLVFQLCCQDWFGLVVVSFLSLWGLGFIFYLVWGRRA